MTAAIEQLDLPKLALIAEKLTNIAGVVKLAEVVGGLDSGRHHRGGLAPYTEPP
jgi:hypothetical protein